MKRELAAMMATESDGVTKKCAPRIMLRSASPSLAAPKSGTLPPLATDATAPITD